MIEYVHEVIDDMVGDDIDVELITDDEDSTPIRVDVAIHENNRGVVAFVELDQAGLDRLINVLQRCQRQWPHD